MSITKIKIHAGQQPTEEQVKEIELASKKTVIPDEDAPELTSEQYNAMAEFVKNRISPHK